MTINTQNSFLISSLLHLLFISIFIAIPKPDYSIVKQVIDISFLFSSIENETQANKKQEEKPIIKSKAEQMKTEKTIEPKTIQHIKESTNEKILSEPEKKKEISQQEQKAHSPIAEIVEMPAEQKIERLDYRASGLPVLQASDVSSLPSLKASDPYVSTARVKSNAYEKISVFKDIATTDSARSDIDKSTFISSFINEIESVKQYPYLARKKGIEGTVVILVHLSKTGELKEIVLKASSGYEILDGSAMELIKKVTPFRHGYHSDLKIEIPITYKLTR